MTTKRYEKVAVGDLAYIHPSTLQSEGRAGIVTAVSSGRVGDEPHVTFQPLNGAKPVTMDYKQIGYGGGPPRKVKGNAIVKWRTDSIPQSEAHRLWPVEQISEGALDYYWVQVRDEWEGRLHWLRSRSEFNGDDSIYTLDVKDAEGRSYSVAMQEFPH